MPSQVERLAEKLLQERATRANRPPTVSRDIAPGADFDPYDVCQWKTIAGGDPGYLPQAMVKGQVGFHIQCKACGQRFESKGWAYCLKCLDIPAEERRAMKPAAVGRMCRAPGCENFIPRKARADIQYCSKGCKDRAYRARRETDNEVT